MLAVVLTAGGFRAGVGSGVLAASMVAVLMATSAVADAAAPGTATSATATSATTTPTTTPTPTPTPTPVPKPPATKPPAPRGYVPKIKLPARSGSGLRIVYSRALMHVWLVNRANKVLRDFPVTGRPDWPRPGRYRVYSKSLHTSNPHYHLVFDYMTRFAYGRHARIGFHTIPRRNGHFIQPVSTLGQPLGLGGCVRMATVNARLIYRWAKIGTRVVVLR